MTQGAFAAVLHDGKILLVKPPDWVSEFSGHWNFPGGVVEKDEKLEDGAKREVFEETGVKCSIESLLDTAYNDKFDTSISIFRATYISGGITTQPEEISDAQWFTLEETLALTLAFDIKQTLTKLIEQL